MTSEKLVRALRVRPDKDTIKTGWVRRHNEAFDSVVRPTAGEPRDFEACIILVLDGWLNYAEAHKARYESPIGEDGVLGAEWTRIARGIRGLLNGECGRLDCGTLDGFILRTARENGVEEEEL
jgi:hypothetical protein